MERIEFLSSTGLSFYSPDGLISFSETLLNKHWNYRVLKSAKGAISLQQSETMITDAVSTDGEELTDVGGFVIRFQEVLNKCVGRWIPLPYSRKTMDGRVPREPWTAEAAKTMDGRVPATNESNSLHSSGSRSNDWIRLFINRPPFSDDESLYRFVFAVDTTINPNISSQNVQGEFFGLCAEDIGLPFIPAIEMSAFWKSPTMLTWVNGIFSNIPMEAGEPAIPKAKQMAAFLSLMDGLISAESLPEIVFLRPEGDKIDVHLILDLGNSRACGLLAEHLPGKPVNLDECIKLEIRDLLDPSIVYTEPFDTSFKFRPQLFFDTNDGIPHAGINYHWPSIVRLGAEASRMESSDIGDTGMSSPKRYLWDDGRKNFPWYFNSPGSSLGKKIGAPFLKYLDESGDFKGDKACPPFEPCYPPSSMMTFVLLELINHAYAQINSFEYRKSRGQRLAARVLRSIVITTPSGMPRPEVEIYRIRAQNAVDLFFHAVGMANSDKPELIMDLDEASAVQLTYLYGEIKHRFLGEPHEAISSLGRSRLLSDGSRCDLFRLASIDIGGGTSDLMIAEYHSRPGQSACVNQKLLFSEGFSIAGDEIAKRIIEKIILKKVFQWISEKNPEANWDDFRMFFGPGSAGRDRSFTELKGELCRQIWLPMAHRHLEFAEIDLQESKIQVSFDKFFPERLPGMRILDFFSEQMKSEFGVEMTLAEIPWELSKQRIDSVISNVMENILRIFAEIIAQFDCDAVILGGKPSSLPAIRRILTRFMPVAPDRILGLKGYPVGSWYPFSQKGGGIADPKTTCVIGGAVWLFAKHHKTIDGFSLVADSTSIGSRECFIGTFNPEFQTIQHILFPTPDDSSSVIVIDKPTCMGIRRVDSSVCLANPIWEIIPQKQAVPGSVKVSLTQDSACRESVKITRVEYGDGKVAGTGCIRLKLRTMASDQYWLDTGNFDV